MYATKSGQYTLRIYLTEYCLTSFAILPFSLATFETLPPRISGCVHNNNNISLAINFSAPTQNSCHLHHRIHSPVLT